MSRTQEDESPETAEDVEKTLVELSPRLRAYLYRMTASVEDTEDIFQDTCLKAIEKAATFRGESSLKTWIYAIATNNARNHFRVQKRWPVNSQDIAKDWCPSEQYLLDAQADLRQEGLQAELEIKEHIHYCFSCIMKSVVLEQQIALMLKEIHDFRLSEIAVIMNKTETAVKHLLHKARKIMTDVFEERCAIVSKQGMCHQCSEINGFFNPKQKSQEELVKLKMHREAQKPNVNREQLFDLRLELVREVNPFDARGSALHIEMMKMTRTAIKD